MGFGACAPTNELDQCFPKRGNCRENNGNTLSMRRNNADNKGGRFRDVTPVFLVRRLYEGVSGKKPVNYEIMVLRAQQKCRRHNPEYIIDSIEHGAKNSSRPHASGSLFNVLGQVTDI